MHGATPLRVTLWLTKDEIKRIHEIAFKSVHTTPRQKPRTGIICTELIRMQLETL